MSKPGFDEFLEDMGRWGSFKKETYPFLARGTTNCPHCGKPLTETGIQKLLSPPLDVLVCEHCKVEYSRDTAQGVGYE